MKHKNTRKELLVSILAMLLCVSMLIGSTFAWFTDSVTSGMNTIAAGNLDIELLADGNKVDANTALFDDVALWEPGVVVYENLQIANVGTLALKYELSLNFGNENYLNGHSLSEVLKVAIIDKIADGASRAEVLEAAKAAGAKALNQFVVKGDLEAKTSSDEQTVVIFWEPNDNDIDNLYNANNGQETSDGEALHIEFGINLLATQKMSENDSFGNDYDEFASFLPHASTNDVSNEYDVVPATNGIGGEVVDLDLAFAMQFLPNETYEQAQASNYRFYHADFVVKADKDIAAESIALAGYYVAFCEDYNDGNWVYLTAPETVEAGTEVRLVGSMGVTINYEEICLYANDGVGFLCGATDMTGENAGTTITVELRLYETTGDPSTPDGPKNEETGNYITVGTYSHTF